MVYADQDGNIYDHPELLLLCDRNGDLAQPRPDEMTPIPDECEFFLLPKRKAIGLDAENGTVEILDETAVAVFVCPAHTVTAIAAYEEEENAPVLPLLSYAAVGYGGGKFWVCAKKVDEDKRQIFTRIPQKAIELGAKNLRETFPQNKLIEHLTNCAVSSGCPAAKNLCLGRFEAPLPTAQTCNARCIGCISKQDEDVDFCSPQDRISFTPTVDEIVEIMTHHGKKESRPIFSFGQGCEGEPLTEAKLLTDAITAFRANNGKGTVNINTNGSLPKTIEPLAKAGLSSIRVSMNSLQKNVYEAYYRPKGYTFEDVLETIAEAKKHKLFVSINYLFFPGFNDSEEELAELIPFIEKYAVDFLQLRNLNLDPRIYKDMLKPFGAFTHMGFNNFKKRIKKSCPNINFGYFNPYVI